MYLTRSFRFDNNIARVANMVLATFKNEKRTLVGTPHDKHKPKWDPERYTVIARTNAALFDKAAQLNKTHILGFVGGVQGYRFNGLKDVYHLYAGNHHQIVDNYINGFSDYKDLKSYAQSVEEIELLGICKVVENYRHRLPALVDAITQKAADPEHALRSFLPPLISPKGCNGPMSFSHRIFSV